MSDLGDILIRERPLIIREAIVGGRRLTKSLYMQLPEIDYLPIDASLCHIVATVNHHWKDCGAGRDNWSGLLHTHHHIVLNENGSPKRGTVWEGVPHSARIYIDCDDIPGGRALTALIARRRLEGVRLNYRRQDEAGHTVDVLHRGQNVSLTFDGKVDALRTWYSGEKPAALVALALPATKESELMRQVDESMAHELEWRERLAQLWKLVTEETPQVLL